MYSSTIGEDVWSIVLKDTDYISNVMLRETSKMFCDLLSLKEPFYKSNFGLGLLTHDFSAGKPCFAATLPFGYIGSSLASFHKVSTVLSKPQRAQPRENFFYNCALSNYLNIILWCKGKSPSWCYATLHPANKTSLTCNSSKWGIDVCLGAAEGGHLNILKWSQSNGLTWDPFAYHSYIKHGKLAHIGMISRSFFWKEAVAEATVKGNHIHIIKFAIDNKLITNYHDLQRLAALCGSLDVFKMFYDEAPSSISTHTFTNAARGNHLEFMKWIYENIKNSSKYLTTDACNSAASEGNIEILEWIDSKIEITLKDVKACEEACSYNHLETLKYLRRTSRGWSESCCDIASRKGYLEILQYLVEEDCPKDISNVYEEAVVNNQFEIIKFLYSKGLTPSLYTIRRQASNRNYFEIVHWVNETLISNGIDVSKYNSDDDRIFDQDSDDDWLD